MAYLFAGQHDDDLFGNDTEEFIIRELLKIEILNFLVRRWP